MEGDPQVDTPNKETGEVSGFWAGTGDDFFAPWGIETAAPLWFDILNQLIL